MKKLLFLFCCLSITGAAQDVTFQELVNRRQYTEVINKAESLTQADSADYATMYAVGQAYEGLLRYPKAYTYYQYCLSMDTTNIDILNSLARMATNIGKGGDAQSYFHKVLEKDSMNFYANFQLARLYQQLGEYEKAIDKYRFLTKDDLENPVLLRNIGDCYIRMESLNSAALTYFRAYSSNRENASLASALINTLLRLGAENAADALAICDTALYYNPGNRQLTQNKGMALYMNKKYAEADTLYTRLMMAGDSTALTLKYAGVCKYYAGKYMDAIEPLEKTYLIDPSAADVCLLLGSALGKTYDRQRAFSLFDEAEENMKPDPLLVRQLLRFRAEIYRKDGKFEMSDKLYYQAWKDEPENLDILSALVGYHNPSHIDFLFNNPKERQLTIFLRVLYMKESIKADKLKPNFAYHRYFLESLHRDMFFRSRTEEPMLSPDGKKSMLKIDELREIIDQLPESTKEEKEIRDKEAEMAKQMQEHFKKQQEEKRKEETKAQ